MVHRRKVDLTKDDQGELLRRMDHALLDQAQHYAQVGSKLDDILSQLRSANSANVTGHQKTQDLIVQNSNKTLEQQALKQFMSDLSFEHLDSRQQLKDAYPDTCEWIWNAPEDYRSSSRWSNFPTWLKSGNGIFWIQGKAGSGKSTLMSYISEHEDLYTHLGLWTNSQQVIVPVFFFWRLGSPEQKSVEGLLRSLLHQILETGPAHLSADLMSFVHVQRQKPGQQSGQGRVRWRINLLVKLLREAINRLQDKWFICFLIDGLDEFEGDPQDQQRLVDILVEVAGKSNVKMCLSSRPERHLIQAFSQSSQLRMQDFNHDDISRYVDGTLGNHSRMKDISARDPRSVKILLEELSYKAEGVFLWAYLAVANIIQGLGAEEDFDALTKRVERLSKSLNGIFRQMLSQLEDVHLEELALVLEIIRRSKDYELHYNESSDPSLLVVALALGKGNFSNVDVALLESDPLQLVDLLHGWQKALPQFSRAIRARGCGLLEVFEPETEYPERHGEYSEHQELLTRVLAFPFLSLQLIHRSVWEFLETDEDANRTLAGHMPAPQDQSLDVTLFRVSTLEPMAP